MQVTHTKLVLLLLMMIPVLISTTELTCLNNGTYNVQSDSCTCLPQYLGKNCDVLAYEINETDILVPVGSDYTFMYFEPQEKVLYRFLLSFCPSHNNQILDLLIFAQQQQPTGSINQTPKSLTDTRQFQMGSPSSSSSPSPTPSPNSCAELQSTMLMSTDKKSNNKLQRIVIGIKLLTTNNNNTNNNDNDSLLNNQEILVKCQISYILTFNFLVTVLIGFLVVVAVLVVVSLAVLLRKKYVQSRMEKQRIIKKMNCVNALMPTTKYHNLVEDQADIIECDALCSICLCQFEKLQDVRRTPCGHIYHSKCLQSWCNSHMNCPICRTNFEEEEQRNQKVQEIQIIEETVRRNIREPIL